MVFRGEIGGVNNREQPISIWDGRNTIQGAIGKVRACRLCTVVTSFTVIFCKFGRGPRGWG